MKKLTAIIAIVLLALAIVGAGWKWSGVVKKKPTGSYQIAGWSWGDRPPLDPADTTSGDT